MAQKIALGGFSGSGVGAVLIIAGNGLNITEVSESTGDFAIFAGVLLLIAFGLLGIVGIISKYK